MHIIIIELDSIGVSFFYLQKIKTIGGEAMAIDAIQTVKQAEEKAKEILDTANVEAKKLMDDSVKKGEEDFQRILEEAYANAESIKAKAVKEGEAIAKPILDEGKALAEAIENMDEGKLREVSKIIMERIVKNNGNS